MVAGLDKRMGVEMPTRLKSENSERQRVCDSDLKSTAIK